jgi:hypothetical protein
LTIFFVVQKVGEIRPVHAVPPQCWSQGTSGQLARWAASQFAVLMHRLARSNRTRSGA